MEVRLVSDAGVEWRPIDQLGALLDGDDGLVWVDIPTIDARAVQVLTEVFGFHLLAVRDCEHRNHVPKVHVYTDHEFVALHAPALAKGGHVHYLELDQFIGPNYLVTVHGPLNPLVDPELALRETGGAQADRGVAAPPSSPFELSHAVVSMLARNQEAFVTALAENVGLVEQRVMGSDVGDPEQFLEELFRVRHGLVAVGTMAALSREVYGRMATLSHLVPEQVRSLVDDLLDQFGRVRSVADGENQFLHAVIEFYQTRTNTKMTIAAERLAVIAAVTLPITALSGIYGMNVIVNDRTQPVQLAMVLVVRAAMSATLLRWARRQRWW